MQKFLITLVTLATIVLVLAIPASATLSTPVSGSIRGLGWMTAPPTFTEKGKTCFVEGDFGYQWMGDISGNSVAQVEIVQHGPCFREDGTTYPKGTFREDLKYRGTFDGTVNGEQGRFEFVLVLKFTPVEGGPPEVPDFDGSGRFVTLGGSDGLDGLHGVLIAEISRRAGVTSFDYVGDIHFDPD
jgi:hypothetical protein